MAKSAAPRERTSATVTTISMQCDNVIDAPSASRGESHHDVYPPAPRLLHERRTWRWTTSRLYRTFCGLHISFWRPPVHETCKNSRRRDERRQRSQIVIRASAHGNKSTKRVEVVSGARELDRVVGEGRAGLASSSGRRKRRGGRGGHSCGSARGDDGRVGALCASRPV